MTFDRILRGAHLADLNDRCDIALAGDRVSAVAPRLARGAEHEHALRDRLVLPGFVNSYLRLPFTADMEDRAVRLLETSIRHGATTVHVSVPSDQHDCPALLRRLAGLRARFADRLTVVLALRLDAQWRTRLHELASAIDAAKRAGADAIEIAVEARHDHLALTAALAKLTARNDLALDLEIDASLPAGEVALETLALPHVLETLESLQERPPVRLLHATALAAVHGNALAPVLTRLRALGLALVLCPFETLRVAGRTDSSDTRRGLPRLRELISAGVAVRLGSGEAVDAAALDPLSMAWMAAYAGHTGTPAALEQMRTLVAPGRVAPGWPADLVVLEAPSFAQAVVDHAEKALVFKAGQVVHRAARAAERVTIDAPARLLIRRARLMRRPDAVDVLIEGGTIREVAPRIEPGMAQIVEAQGHLLVPAFVDAHLHVDKTFVMDGLALGPSILTVAEAIDAMHRAKIAYTRTDLLTRGRLTLTRALRHGITAIRAQCDVDPIVGLMALEALLALRREFADRLDLQIVAFPQEGLVGKPQAIDLMRRAMKLGADVVGGGPLDPDYRQHIAQVFELAQEFDAPVDLHADLPIAGLRPLAEWEAPLIAKHARDSKRAGRVAIGHFAASSTLQAHEVRIVADQLAGAQVTVTALPASEMYRQGMADPVNSRRGVPRVRDLLAAGVNVVFASNNLRDAFVTFGNADMLEQALLCATATQLDDMDTVLEMVTSRAARQMGLSGRAGVDTGQQADLVLLDARTAAEAIGDQVEKLLVIRRGRILARHRVELDASPAVRERTPHETADT